MTTIELIEKAFDSHGIKYRTVTAESVSFIEAGYGIKGGPTVRAIFLSQGETGNDVQVRVTGLMNRVGKEKKAAVLEACNRINSEMRFFKFYLDKEDNVIGQADLPVNTGADFVGECCFELFARLMGILDSCYHYFPEAIYKNETLANMLQELKEHPITIPEP